MNMTSIEIIKYIIKNRGYETLSNKKLDAKTNLFEYISHLDVMDLFLTLQDIQGYTIDDKYIDNAKTVEDFIQIFRRGAKAQSPNLYKNLNMAQKRELLNLRTKQVLYRNRRIR